MLTRKPRKGDRIHYDSSDKRFAGYFIVVATPPPGDSLCWIRPERGGDANPFIWTFHDIPLNTMFTIVEEGELCEPAHKECAENANQETTTR